MQKISTLLIAKKSKLALYSAVLGTALLSTMLNSCSRSKINDPIGPVPLEAEFVTSGVYTTGYYIKSTNAAYAIPVGFSVKSDADRTLNFTYSYKTSTAGSVTGQQFTAPASVVIKAGTVLDSLRVSGNFAGYAGGRRDTITVKMNANGVPTPDNATTFKLVAQQYCDVVPANLTGNYTNTKDYYPSISAANASASKYTAVISAFTPAATANTASLTIKNIGLTPDVGFGPFQATDPAATGITVVADYRDASSFKLSIASQAYMSSLYTYGAATIVSTAGSFSSCDQTFSLTYQVRVAAGSFSNQSTVLVR